MNEEDGAFDLGRGSGEVLGRTVGDVHDIGFNTGRWRRGRPPDTYGAKREFYFAKEFEARFTFAPGEREWVFFCVYIDAGCAKRGGCPLDGALHGGRAGD